MIRANTLPQGIPSPHLVIEDVTDPAAIENHRIQRAAFRRNSDWLQAHWADLMPRARGKFVAVAAQEAFLADTPQEAWDWAARVHPEDTSPLFQYVRTELGPRIYADTWKLAGL